MSKLQRQKTKCSVVNGKRTQYYNYVLVIPHDVAEKTKLAMYNIMYAKIVGKNIHLEKNLEHKNTKMILPWSKLTRYYNERPYYVTKIIIPKEFVKILDLHKGQKLNVQSKGSKIVIAK